VRRVYWQQKSAKMGATCGQKRLFVACCWLKSVSIRANLRRNHCLCDSQRPPRLIAHTKPRRSQPSLRPEPCSPLAKHAKSAKTTNKQNKNGFSLGDLCVFARDIILLATKTCSLPSELPGEDFELLRVCSTECGIPGYDLLSVASRLCVRWPLVSAGGRAAFIRVHRRFRPSWFRGFGAWYVPCGLGAGGKFPCFRNFLATANTGVRLIYRERFVLSCPENSPRRHRNRGGKLGGTKPLGAGSAEIADCGVRIEGRRNKADLEYGACPRKTANLGPAKWESGAWRAKQTQFGAGVLAAKPQRPAGNTLRRHYAQGPFCETKPIWRLSRRESEAHDAKQT